MRIRAAFGKESGTDWCLWFAISEADWEGGKDLPKVPDGFESREVWIDLDYDEVQDALHTPKILGTIGESDA